MRIGEFRIVDHPRRREGRERAVGLLSTADIAWRNAFADASSGRESQPFAGEETGHCRRWHT
jgi:hypothetical protein